MNNNKRKGFGSMTKLQRQTIASMGGKAAHVKGTGHQWTKEEAVIAGKKGGVMRQKKKQQSLEKHLEKKVKGLL